MSKIAARVVCGGRQGVRAEVGRRARRREQDVAAHAEAAAEVEALDLHAELAAQLVRERAQLARARAVVHDLALGRVVAHVAREAHVVVQPDEVEVRGREHGLDGLARLAGREVRAELALADAQRRLEARILGEQVAVGQLHPHDAAHARAERAGGRVEPPHLVERVDVDLPDGEPSRGLERELRLAVAVQDDVLGRHARRERELELVLRAGVDLRAAPVQEADDRERVVRLHRVRDLAARVAPLERREQPVEVALDRRAGDRPERRAVRARELARSQPSSSSTPSAPTVSAAGQSGRGRHGAHHQRAGQAAVMISGPSGVTSTVSS